MKRGWRRVQEWLRETKGLLVRTAAFMVYICDVIVMLEYVNVDVNERQM